MYYLSWLRNKILHNDPEVEKKQGWATVGDLEGCVHYKVGESAAIFIYFYLIILVNSCWLNPLPLRYNSYSSSQSPLWCIVIDIVSYIRQVICCSWNSFIVILKVTFRLKQFEDDPLYIYVTFVTIMIKSLCDVWDAAFSCLLKVFSVKNCRICFMKKGSQDYAQSVIIM